MTLREQLEKLVSAGERFRSTPIVDDDFPCVRDEFDAELSRAKERLSNKQYRTVIVDGCMGEQQVLMEV